MFALSRNSSLYKIAYGWSKKSPPEQTNLCPFFWRVILSAILMWPLVVFVTVLTQAVGLAIQVVFTPLAVLGFGYRPVGLEWKLGSINIPTFKRIQRWPEFLDLHFMPFWILVIIAVVLGFCVVIWKFVIQQFIVGFIYSRPPLAIAFSILLFIGAIKLFFFIMETLEEEAPTWWKLTKAYVQAKKEKVCPTITFQ